MNPGAMKRIAETGECKKKRPLSREEASFFALLAP
jgi:hypothetical protein